MRLCTCQWNAVRLNHAPTGCAFAPGAQDALPPRQRTPRTWRRVRPSTRMPSTSTRQSPQEIVRQSAAGPSSSSFTTNSCGRGPSAAAKKEADPCAARESRIWSTIPTPRKPLRGVGGMAGVPSDLPPAPSRQSATDSQALCSSRRASSASSRSAHVCANFFQTRAFGTKKNVNSMNGFKFRNPKCRVAAAGWRLRAGGRSCGERSSKMTKAVPCGGAPR